jgi:hypothetical protein
MSHLLLLGEADEGVMDGNTECLLAR